MEILIIGGIALVLVAISLIRLIQRHNDHNYILRRLNYYVKGQSK